MKSILTLILTQFILLSSAQPPSWLWSKSLGGSQADNGICRTADWAGNSYLTGQFNGSADFDPGPGAFTFTAASALSDVFITKLDSSGNLLWAKQIGGTAADVATALTITPFSSDIYLTGYFGGTADFDPGQGVFTLTATGNQDVFVVKLDSSGNFQWAIRVGSTGNDQGLTIATEETANGNIYLSGKFSGTADFDPDTAAYNLTAVGTSDIFILKLNAAGQFLWARSFTGNGASDELALAIAITPDSSGSILTTGYYSGTTDFDPGPNSFDLTAVNHDIFLTKIDSAGNFVWARQLGGTGQDQGNDLRIDPDGNIYTTGFFSATCDFDPGPNNFDLNAVGGTDIYLAKFDSNGNLIRANSMGGPGNDFGSNLVLNLTSGSTIYLTGGFQSTADFDPGQGTFNVSSAGGLDIFILNTDTTHNLNWIERIGSTGSEYGLTMSRNELGIVTVNGIFASPSITFGSTTLTNQSLTNTDVFIARLETNLITSIADQNTAFSQITIYPNPAHGQFTISGIETPVQRMIISDLSGKEIYIRSDLTTDKITIDVVNLNAGMYLITFLTDHQNFTRKLIVEN